jgi:hypothetical protein
MPLIRPTAFQSHRGCDQHCPLKIKAAGVGRRESGARSFFFRREQRSALPSLDSRRRLSPHAPELAFHYSWRRDSIGSSLEARKAGIMPLIRPIAPKFSVDAISVAR